MRKNWAALALTGMLCLTTFAGTQTVSAETADSAKQVDIVFTHDTHSHLNTFTTIVDEAEKEVMQELEEDGTLKEIYEYWFGADSEETAE